MRLPSVTEAQIEAAIPDVTDVGHALRGGQKLVFPCKIAGVPYALMVMLADPSTGNGQPRLMSRAIQDEVRERAEREVRLMQRCDSPHLVKAGPIGVNTVEIDGERLIYFAEEWIDGESLATTLGRNAQLPIGEVVKLGIHIASALELIWNLDSVHRDIKPANILRRTATGEYVLLDMGIAFDLSDISLTQTGRRWRTPGYVSPEQINPDGKRGLTVRSDLFVLGIVLYQAATGVHPFTWNGIVCEQSETLIVSHEPALPSTIRRDVPRKLDTIIMRLLAKKLHVRYSEATALKIALSSVHV